VSDLATLVTRREASDSSREIPCENGVRCGGSFTDQPAIGRKTAKVREMFTLFLIIDGQLIDFHLVSVFCKIRVTEKLSKILPPTTQGSPSKKDFDSPS
jgi:hypothetical protein